MPEEKTAKEPPSEPDAISRNAEFEERWLEPLRNALYDLQFGSVVIIVQDGKVVQIDRTEKRRLDRLPA